MALLDKFLILFETDADEAKKSVEGFNDSLDDTETSADKAALSIGDLVSAYLALATVKATVLDSAFRTDTIGKFSETLGFNIQEVDAWGAAVERNGGSAESFMGSISALNDQLTELSLTGGGAAAETLARLGINAANAQGDLKGVFDLLPEIADSFQGLSNQESFGLGKRLGLDQGTILLLQQGRGAVSDLVEQQRQLGGMTEESYKASAEFNDELDNTSRAMESLAIDAGKVILPFFTRLLEALQGAMSWMKQHKEFMTGFFLAIGTAITLALIPALKALAIAIKTNPLYRLAAIAGTVGVAFAALYEDVKAYIGGQESFIGKLFAKYEWLEKGIKGAIEGILWAWGQLSDIMDWTKLLFTDPMEALDQLKDGFLNLWNYIKGLFDFSGIFDGLPSWLGGSELAANTQAGLDMQQQYANNPVNSISSNSMFNTSQIQRSIEISMGGVNVDARGMSQQEAQAAFGNSLKDQISHAIENIDDGVNR
jgi:TP901 family phage tail tape measure protein